MGKGYLEIHGWCVVLGGLIGKGVMGAEPVGKAWRASTWPTEGRQFVVAFT